MEQLDQYYNIIYRNTTGTRLPESELMAAIINADAVVAGTESFSSRIIDNAERLKIISRVGVGLDSIDMETVANRGIHVLTTPNATIQPVAEHALALLFSVSKKITEYNTSIRQGDHKVRPSSMIRGKHVGIIGLGKIGFRTAELLSCLGCSLHFYDPFINHSVPVSWKKMDSIENLFRISDIITLHAPAQKGNTPLLNREAFNQCRTGVIVINTARGSLVDENALYDALQSGKVAGAGLDVFRNEPYTGPLCSLPQVVLTPHVASNTIESRRAMELEAVQGLINILVEINR
jgi:D-3-phosphoglycerate dehydrogenase